jgi:hypothetical protein
MLHLIASIEVIIILKNFLISKEFNNNNFYLFGIIFFFLPQNLINVLWIAGRSDLICGVFIFSSVIMFQKLFLTSKLKYLLWFSVTLILALMTKESALIINFYSFFMIVFYKNINNNKSVLKYSVAVLILIDLLYFIFRYVIFGSISPGFILNELSFYSILKTILYGIWTLFIPYDILDFIFLLNKNWVLNYFSLIVIFVFLLILISGIIKKTKLRNIIIFLLFISLGSLSIYVLTYPSMRLMYLHLPMILLICIFSQLVIGKKLKLILTFCLLLIIILGDYNIYSRQKQINEYTSEILKTIDTNKNILIEKEILSLFSLSRIGQSWALTDMNYLLSFYNNQYNYITSNKCLKLVDFETSSFNCYKNSINYKYVNDSSFSIIAKNDSYFLMNDSAIFTKKSDTEYNLGDDFSFKILKYSENIREFPEEILVFVKKNKMDSYLFLYFWNDSIKISDCNTFMERIR